MTLRAAANTIDGLQHEREVYTRAFMMLCQDTSTDYAEYLTAARREILQAMLQQKK